MQIKITLARKVSSECVVISLVALRMSVIEIFIVTFGCLYFYFLFLCSVVRCLGVGVDGVFFVVFSGCGISWIASVLFFQINIFLFVKFNSLIYLSINWLILFWLDIYLLYARASGILLQ